MGKEVWWVVNIIADKDEEESGGAKSHYENPEWLRSVQVCSFLLRA